MSTVEALREALNRIIEVRNERDKVLMIAEAALLASAEPAKCPYGRFCGLTAKVPQ